jgi:hypothetical protein
LLTFLTSIETPMSKRQLFVPAVVDTPRTAFVWHLLGWGTGTVTGDGSSPVDFGVTYTPWDGLPRTGYDTDRDLPLALVTKDEVVL